MERQIAHLDIPDFYISLEGLRRPEINRRPVAIAEPGNRAVVQAINDIARGEGLSEGMPLSHALRVCRRTLIIPPDQRFYREQHEHVISELGLFSPLVEGVLPGRYFIDLTGTRRLWGPGPDVACRIEKALVERRGLHARAGLASNKVVSRVAANCATPGGLGCVMTGEETRFLIPLPITFLPGVGLKTASRLSDLNIGKIGQLAALSAESIVSVFGNMGTRLLRIARGIDATPVLPQHKTSHFCFSRHLERDEIDRDILENTLFEVSEEAGWTLRCRNRYPGKFSIEIRYADGATSRATHIISPNAVQADRRIFTALLPVFRNLFQRRVALRRMTLEFHELSTPLMQLSLFPWEQEFTKPDTMLQEAVDKIRRRFGPHAVSWGRNSLPRSSSN